jgi:multidrug efflux pump subunit AcrA (membrane-fusion protein)
VYRLPARRAAFPTEHDGQPTQAHAPSKDPAPTAARRPRRTLAIGTLAVVIVGGLLWWHPWRRTPADATGAAGPASGAMAGGGHRGRGGPAAMANVPQPVSVATATQGEMPIVLSALGTVTPLANVTVKSQLSGYLQSVAFQEGQIVKKGDLLAQIDLAPVPGLARERRRHACARRGAARDRAPRSETLSDAAVAGLDRIADGRHAGVARQAI